MAHCPSAVQGAVTAVNAVADGVEVTITANDEASVNEVRSRAKYLVEASAKDAVPNKHEGDGSGGGVLGQCPVVLNDTALSATDVEHGTKVTVKPAKPENVGWLKTETLARAAKYAPKVPSADEAPPGGQPADEKKAE